MGSDLPIDLHAIFSPEHYEAVGPALWLLVWAVSSQSEDGWVRGGIWLSRQTIANEIGCSVSSVKRHLGRLEPDYLTVERGHAGLRIRLKNRADLSRPRVNSDPTPGQSWPDPGSILTRPRVNPDPPPGSILTRPRVNPDPTPGQSWPDPGSILTRPRVNPDPTSESARYKESKREREERERERERERDTPPLTLSPFRVVRDRLETLAQTHKIPLVVSDWLKVWFEAPRAQDSLVEYVERITDKRLSEVVAHWSARRSALGFRYPAKFALSDLREMSTASEGQATTKAPWRSGWTDPEGVEARMLGRSE